MTELLDVYDIDGNRTGETVERYKHSKPGAYYLCIHAYIITPDNKFIIQRRSMEKKYFPGIWDITCGAADSGEDSYTAALREVREELGLDLSECKYKLVGKNIYFDCLNDVYFFYTDYRSTDCVLDYSEVMEVKDITPAELLHLVNDSPFKSDEYYNMIKDAIDF
jgi:8-oxo-dGTP pyrophosphatase MutT (NUDIX family)